jgi:hypothetical protein
MKSDNIVPRYMEPARERPSLRRFRFHHLVHRDGGNKLYHDNGRWHIYRRPPGLVCPRHMPPSGIEQLPATPMRKASLCGYG